MRPLGLDEPAAEVVRRIFAEYLSGRGDRAIANGLNRDGIPCPSARRPEQNTHRLADGWQGSTIPTTNSACPRRRSRPPRSGCAPAHCTTWSIATDRVARRRRPAGAGPCGRRR
ncbi:recombinase family protein [Actinophytocola xanthii]|uniref:recombinase family protein n=1 Tax=Actinophytocola xanthii TaxID=1912961 RepID=UPI0009FA585F|nr:recombinase family protein [Actinophytocola xanthii]